MTNTESLVEKMLVNADLETDFKRRKSDRVIDTIKRQSYKPGGEWSVEKEYKNVVRVSRPKKALEALRDKVWCLLKEFGIEELSEDRIPVEMDTEGRKETYWIDVLAIDEEFIFAVVCRARDVLGEYPGLKDEILDFGSRHGLIRNAIRREFGGNRRVVFVLATENIHWPDGFKRFADQNKIVVFDEYDLLKLEELTAVAGEGAKYQVYSKILQDVKIKSFSLRVPAIRSKMGGRVYYTFVLSPDELLKMAYVHQRATECTFLELSDSYQRILKKRRIKKIRDYIKRGGYFPGSIILNFNRKITEIGPLGKKNERRDLDMNGVPVILKLPPYYGSAWVIDGQHRLYGYADSPKKRTETLSVVAFVKQPPSEQSKIFLDINQYQSAISSDLKWDLYEDLYCNPSNDKETRLYAISRVGKELNRAGPLKNRIKIPKDELVNPSAHIGLETVCKCIQRNAFLNRQGDPFYDEDVEVSIRTCAESINMFLGMVTKGLASEWAQRNDHFVCTTGGVVCLISIFRDILHALHIYLNTHEFEEMLRPFGDALVSSVRSLSPDTVRAFKQASVGRAQSPKVQEYLTREIQKKQPYLSPFLKKAEKKEQRRREKLAVSPAEFESFFTREESATYETKGSLRLNMDKYLRREGKELDNEVAVAGVLKTIVSFLNAEHTHDSRVIVVGLLESSRYKDVEGFDVVGNYLLVGINDEYSKKGWDGYCLRLSDLISTHISREAFSFIETAKCTYTGKDFCIITAPKTGASPDKWYYLDGAFYVREANRNKELKGEAMDAYKKRYARSG